MCKAVGEIAIKTAAAAITAAEQCAFGLFPYGWILMLGLLRVCPLGVAVLASGVIIVATVDTHVELYLFLLLNYY